MTDRFSIDRQRMEPAEEAVEMARAGRDRARDAQLPAIRRLVKLGAGYYFDPNKKQVLKKTGDTYQFVRHDRRRGARRTQAEAEERQFRLVMGGLFWDAKDKKLYRKAGEAYVLYSPDRRKRGGKSPSGSERRVRR